jgi:hypothetical protein
MLTALNTINKVLDALAQTKPLSVKNSIIELLQRCMPVSQLEISIKQPF